MKKLSFDLINKGLAMQTGEKKSSIKGRNTMRMFSSRSYRRRILLFIGIVG